MSRSGSAIRSISPRRSPEQRSKAMDTRQAKGALLAAILPDVPFDGWTDAALTHAAERIGLDRGQLRDLCPGGARDLVAWFSHWADRETLRELEGRDLSALKIHERI